jgi:hypothetical protein
VCVVFIAHRPARVFGYDVDDRVVAPRVVGGGTFAAEDKARLREERRRGGKPGLQRRKGGWEGWGWGGGGRDDEDDDEYDNHVLACDLAAAIEALEREAAGGFLAPQLPHAWVADRWEGRFEKAGASRDTHEAHRALVGTIAAYGAALQKRLKPVARCVRVWIVVPPSIPTTTLREPFESWVCVSSLPRQSPHWLPSH